MPTAVRAAVATEPGVPYTLHDLQLDDPRPEEVLVRIVGTGVCHTDVVVRDKLYPVPQPIVGGHEGAGVVEAVGDAVRDVAPGDHVVLANLSCGTCRLCRTGNPSYCLNFSALNFSGARPDGSSTMSGLDEVRGSLFGQSSFATHALAHERNTVVMPGSAPLELLGPLGCGVQTGAGAVLNALRPQAGSRVAVYGAGAVGLSALLAAKLVGCPLRIVVEPRAQRRALAEDLGATHTIDPGATDPVAAVKDLTGGEGVDYTLECSGEPGPFRQAVDSLTQCGECALVGALDDVDRAFHDAFDDGTAIKPVLLMGDGH
ncbi:NAD(P)-dependent alcohol dehydrogenase [Pseudonocardia sp. KRD-184]|uniref:NAD(P)-dependent alcohol dehydrogenase n=1 Tax=Pseudonocardia oceani TaxID=2792013 RepID=A0ABS6U8T5_9PSEU|nr:NAD(P)-dependent alcohol dehydrogenase [Pseudonocardia oceani]MBW0089347.1 NAD(P)-dependent alcohol dehydrogenase [Pseudonocardia oceani]MBW0095944.1 NAD(P)-dependent alcohol dehydrogenase [Pseudonocardia oceani]MBW0108643.1 NAD(P)-dependent alcohol dehydrogenase [Pseudonocardia oceani]MBW0122771.1 NAD(P)-dependent alcohol dehydrogenase [Pseudonocardia oceani]MBW0128613.1 NAD(P)-dependent alcohol dehydrogenase [Pseudonocardia oceani]